MTTTTTNEVSPKSPRQMAVAYRETFGFQLRGRLSVIAHRYPNVEAPDYISWEGVELTGADTTDKVRALLKIIPWI